MTSKKAVIWDMDGTLVDSEHIAVEAMRRALLEAGVRPPEDLHERVVGRAADDTYRWLKSEFNLVHDPLAWEQRKHHYYFSAVDQLAGFTDAITVWHAFAEAGIPQAIFSNSDRAIVDVNLRSVGIHRPGLVTVSRNDVLRGKPDPEGYHRAAYLLGMTCADCIIVEDSTSGAAAALASGAVTVFVPHATVEPPAKVRALQRMEELEEMVLKPR